MQFNTSTCGCIISVPPDNARLFMKPLKKMHFPFPQHCLGLGSAQSPPKYHSNKTTGSPAMTDALCASFSRTRRLGATRRFFTRLRWSRRRDVDVEGHRGRESGVRRPTGPSLPHPRDSAQYSTLVSHFAGRATSVGGGGSRERRGVATLARLWVLDGDDHQDQPQAPAALARRTLPPQRAPRAMGHGSTSVP